MQRLKARVGEILIPSNTEPWEEVRRRLNHLLRGWATYFGYGTRLMAYRAADHHVYEAVRGFLTRRHKVPSRGTRQFSRPRGLREAGRAPATPNAHRRAAESCEMKPVGKPDAGNPHVRFDERGGETDRSRGTAPLLNSTRRERRDEDVWV